MTSFTMFMAVLFFTVYMTHQASATDNDFSLDEDYTDSEEEDTPHEDLSQSILHFLLNQTDSSAVTTTLDGEDTNDPDPDIQAASETLSLDWQSLEETIQMSTEVSSHLSTNLQVLPSSEHGVGGLALSLVSETLEQIFPTVIYESSDAQGVSESSTSTGLSSTLEPTPSATFMFWSSELTTSANVVSGNEISTSVTGETVSSLTLYDSFLPSIHETNIQWSKSSEAHQGVQTRSFFEEFHTISSLFPGTTEHAAPESTDHAELTSTEHTESTHLEHLESISIEHSESTPLEHTELTLVDYPNSTSMGYTASISIENAELTSSESPVLISMEHPESTSTENSVSSSIEPQESTSTEQPASTSTEHHESTPTEHPLLTSIEHVESTYTEHHLSTFIEHAELISTEHPVLISIGHPESTSSEHPVSTYGEHTKSTSTENLVSSYIEHAESTSTESLVSTSIDPFERTFTERPVSTSIEHAESASTQQAESLYTLTELPPQDFFPTTIEPSVGSSSWLSSVTSSDTHSDLVSTAANSFVRLSSIGSVDSLYEDSSQDGEIAGRESFTVVSSHGCPSCSSTGLSSDDITPITVHTLESSIFSSDSDFQISTVDMSSALFSPSFSHLDTRSSSLAETVFHTSFRLVGSEAELPSTLSSLPVTTQFLPSGWDIRVSSQETVATTSVLVPPEEHTRSSYLFIETQIPHVTIRFSSSLYLTQAGDQSSDNILHTEASVSSSRHDSPRISEALVSSVRDILSRAQSIEMTSSYMSDTSGVVSSLGFDRIHAPEATDTPTHDSRHAVENDTLSYQDLRTDEQIDTSKYETLHIDGSIVSFTSEFSSHRLVHDSAMSSESLERGLNSERQQIPTTITSEILQTFAYSASASPASSSSSETRLLLTSSLTTTYAVPESISLSTQWTSAGSDYGTASLSQIVISPTTSIGSLTAGESFSVTPSAEIYTSTERISFTSTFLETPFDIPTIPQEFFTSLQRDLLTSTTKSSKTVPVATNATEPSATVEYTSLYIETSTDVVQKSVSNFTIAVYFDGDCEKANEKKYASILNIKMRQFIQNVSQIDDKASILIGHLKCNPNHILVSFIQTDRTLVFLYLNDTFSNSPSFLRIHSLLLKLTGYNETRDAHKSKGDLEITKTDIAIFATASCICGVLIIAGLSIFAKEIYHKKFTNRFSSSPGSFRMSRKTETVALRSIPANKLDYKHVEMNEEAFVNQAYSIPGDDENSSGTIERKTTFPSSEPNSPEEPRDASRSKKVSEKNQGNATKPPAASSGALRNGSSKHESPGYGLIIGLMGYTKRLERQQHRKQHQQQQQKMQFEESSYYAVPQKRSKPTKNQENTKRNATPSPASFSPAPRSVNVEDSPVPPPRHLRTLHEVNEVYESNEELVPFTHTTGTDNSANNRTDTGLDNPSFLNETGRVHANSNDVFHF